ncbi:ATP-binding protein [Methylobacter svalbardensis]|uniref:ATP-binding protein n=1 Tax=Methylobacter svalbardensis TaxID=3080016 RepID=UPI0030EEB7EC
MTDIYQLKRIILIDSFWTGKTVLLNLDGHINLSGTNGAGKTTFLRLIQLFWGERPSNIVSSTGSKKGFLDYYLPRNSSYLIYEYQRPAQQTCHVMIQSDGRAAKYKFIDAPFNKEFYVDEHDLPRDSSSVDRLYRATVETSKLMSVDDYCSVIQCHQLHSGKKGLRSLQRRFAMASSPMTHIEKVISSVIEKIGDFDTIKQMLINISRDKLSHHLLDHEQDKIPFQLNKQHIDAWLADLNASKELDAKQEEFERLLQTIAELKETLNELSHIHYFARQHHQLTLAELDKITQNQAALKAQREQLKQTYELQLDPREDELRTLKNSIKDYDSEIQSLEEQKLNYEQQDAESFAVKASLLEQIIRQQEANRLELEALESKSKEIKQFYEKQLIELAHQHNSQKQQFDQQCTEEQLAKAQKLTETKNLYQQRKEQLRQDKDDRLKPIAEQKSQLAIDFGIAKNSLENIQPSETLEKQSTQTRNQLNTVRQEFKRALQTKNTADKDYSAALASYQATETELKHKKTELQSSQQQHKQCLKRLRPEAGSLHYFLDNEVEGWEHNIGRVIAPELLDSKDLSPQQVESGRPHFYGLELNLDVLADRENLISDKALLEQQEQDLFARLTGVEAEQKQLEGSLVAANKLREHSKTEVHHADLAVTRCNHIETNLQQEEQDLLNQIKTEKEQKRVDIKQKMTRLSQEIEACQQTIKNITDEHQAEQDKLHTEHLGREGTITSDAENTIKAIKLHSDEAGRQYEQEQKRINLQLKSDLQASGADDTIIELSAKQKLLKQQQDEAKAYQERNKDYQNWLSKRWQQNPNLCLQRSNAQQQASKLTETIEQLKWDYKKQRSQISDDIAKQDRLQETNQSLLTLLGNSMEQLKACPPILSENFPDYAASTLPGLTKTTLHKRKQQEQVLSNGKQTLRQLFNNHHRSQLAQEWQKAMEQPSNTYFQVEALDIEVPLKTVLSMVAHIKQATSQQIELHATDVNTFYDHLRQFDRIIKQTGLSLSSHVSEKQYFNALGEIKVNIRTKMNDLEYWQALKNFGDNYQYYCDQRDLTGNAEIPNALLEAMGELTSLLPSTGISIKHLSLFDIEFSITENGQVKHARNAKELKDVSSTGLSYLALITFFTGVTAMLRRNNSTTVIGWPIDELGDLAPENIEAMMTMLEQQNIHILSATPTADRHVLGLFKRRYQLDKQKLHEVKLPESKLDQLLNQLNKEDVSHV